MKKENSALIFKSVHVNIIYLTLTVVLTVSLRYVTFTEYVFLESFLITAFLTVTLAIPLDDVLAL